MLFIFFITCIPTYLFCKPQNEPYPPFYSQDIRLNQIGYYPYGPKIAVIVAQTKADSFQVMDVNTLQPVYSAPLSPIVEWKIAGEKVRWADFSPFSASGNYMIYIHGVGYSYPFRIGPGIYADVFRASIKSFYFQRASMALQEKYAGQWHRPAGHPDQEVVYHPSSGKSGTTSAPGGWYDAGDFGKYTVNGGYSLGLMLFLWEHYPGILGDNTLRIPESGNEISDFLDEMKYQMDWLLTMQDSDGGVFFKVTTALFPGMIMPHSDTMPRYMVGKSTTATLVFASAAARMYRSYRKIDLVYANRCLQAAAKAWNWAESNPDKYFKNPDDIKTGEYGDGDVSEEFFWAAAELVAATSEGKYAAYLRNHMPDLTFREGNSWATFARFLGAMTLADTDTNLPESRLASDALIQSARALLQFSQTNDYFQQVDDFHWGSNSDVLDAAMVLAFAYRTTGERPFLIAIQQAADYIFGNNACGYSFVTGFGTKSPTSVHHRQSQADGIEAPVPGFISGGPNSRLQDAAFATYPQNAPPMKCWVDDFNSYASNEICNNWNAPLVYVLGFLESEPHRP